MQTNQYPFAQELITDIEGNIKKVVIDFQDYLRLLEAIDEGLILAMKEVENETPLNLNAAFRIKKRVNTQYLPSFIKDLKALKSTSY